jgi:CRISPR-associated protein Cas8a1/Csx13
MAESANAITADEFVTSVLRRAWAGLKRRHAADRIRLQRASEYYFNRLRDAKTLPDVRGLISELCAEGAPIAELEKDGLSFFWEHLERDWRKCRDIALMALAT